MSINTIILFGGEKMVSVLYIGQYTESGKFATIQWQYFMEWCKTECNKIIIYSQISYDTICYKMPLYCKINELNKPDETMEIHAYEIYIIDARFWDYIQEYNYNIDNEDDISYIFFFYEEKNIASLEVVDYENYILIEEPVSQEEIFLLNKELVLENIQCCVKGKSDIDSLLQGESWNPLGDNLKYSINCFQSQERYKELPSRK